MLASHQQTKTHQRYHQQQLTPHQVLRKYFGFKQFRPHQLEIITAIANGHDTLAVMPTGSGKSLCFQVPALINPDTTLVISPLIALMKDQVNHLLAKGIPAGLLTSALTKTQQHEQLELFRLRKLKLFYVAPERLKSKKFIQAAKRADVNLLVVDEAHCISQWGHDFRPEYRQITQFIKQLKKPLTLAAFTATATFKTQQDIITNLKMKQAKKFILPVIRQNLNLNVIHTPTLFEKNLTLMRLVKKHQKENGLIYVYSRQSAVDVAEMIKQFFPQISTAYYHAGLEKTQRTHLEHLFTNNKLKLLVATNAFGMGVDKPDINFVIHYQAPFDIESYYQEVGRAGRGGQEAFAYLLHYLPDWLIHQSFLSDSLKNQKLLKLKQMFEFVANQNRLCRNQLIATYFNQPIDSSCKRCDICQNKQNLKNFGLIKKKEIVRLKKLKVQREKLAKKLSLNPNEVATNQILTQIAFFKPKTKSELLKLAGVGKGNFKLLSHLLEHVN